MAELFSRGEAPFLSLYFAAEANEEEQRDRAQGVQSARGAEPQDIPSGKFLFFLFRPFSKQNDMKIRKETLHLLLTVCAPFQLGQTNSSTRFPLFNEFLKMISRDNKLTHKSFFNKISSLSLYIKNDNLLSIKNLYCCVIF